MLGIQTHTLLDCNTRACSLHCSAMTPSSSCLDTTKIAKSIGMGDGKHQRNIIFTIKTFLVVFLSSAPIVTDNIPPLPCFLEMSVLSLTKSYEEPCQLPPGLEPRTGQPPMSAKISITGWASNLLMASGCECHNQRVIITIIYILQPGS